MNGGRCAGLLRATIVVALGCLVVGAPALAGTAPRLGAYKGTLSTNATGNTPREFLMTITHSKCAAPGGTARHKAYCATVSALSLVQATCPATEFVDDAFFPVTEPVALSAARMISHDYTLYAVPDGQIGDRNERGAAIIGSFQYSLSVTTHGTASGSVHLVFNSEGVCDSGPLTFSATRKK